MRGPQKQNKQKAIFCMRLDKSLLSLSSIWSQSCLVMRDEAAHEEAVLKASSGQ
jgi:hypothetical protein